MKTIIIKWLGETENDAKLFYSDSKRLQVFECPKGQYESLKKISHIDFEEEGIYILRGVDDDGNQKVYIGESDKINRRLVQHHFRDERKSFTERIMIITSKDKLFPYSKTELHYMEKKLIEKFNNSKYVVENGNEGQGNLPTAIEQIGLDEELSLIGTALDTFGFDFGEELEAAVTTNQAISEWNDVKVYTKMPKSDTKIFGYLHSDGAITISANQEFSQKSRPNEASQTIVGVSLQKHKNSDSFVVEGDLDGYKIKVVKDFRYKSASGALMLIHGGPTSPFKAWKTMDGKAIEEFNK